MILLIQGSMWQIYFIIYCQAVLIEALKEAYRVCQKPRFPKDSRKIDCIVTVTVRFYGYTCVPSCTSL